MNITILLPFMKESDIQSKSIIYYPIKSLIVLGFSAYLFIFNLYSYL